MDWPITRASQQQATPPEPESLDVIALAPKRAKSAVFEPESLGPESLGPESLENAMLEFENLNVAAPERERRNVTHLGRDVPDFALPGFEILEAALSESGDPGTTPAEQVTPDPGLSQQSILAAALEGYSSWPFLSDSESEQESQAGSELERKLALLLESEPDLELVLDSESELELELETETEPHPGLVSDNVTMADFGHRAPRTVRVVSVVMDRKRPNMVRVASESTRLAG